MLMFLLGFHLKKNNQNKVRELFRAISVCFRCDREVPTRCYGYGMVVVIAMFILMIRLKL